MPCGAPTTSTCSTSRLLGPALTSSMLSPLQELDLALQTPADKPLPRSVIDIPGDQPANATYLAHAQRMLIRATVRKPFRDPAAHAFKDIDALYVEARSCACPRYVIETLNYLRLYQALAAHIRRLDLDASGRWFHDQSFESTAPALRGAIEATDELDTQLTSTKLILGKLQALDNRERARHFFATATDGVADGRLEVLRHDMGAATYFDQATLNASRSSIAARSSELEASLHTGREGTRRSPRNLVLMSCDELYMKTYLPYWIGAIEYVKPLGLTYHFIVTGNAQEATALIRDAEDLRRATARFRGYPPEEYADNASFSFVEVPSWCLCPATFAACARFLYARPIAERTGVPVVIQDIDLCLSDRPDRWLQALPRDKIGLASNSVGHTIDPWRKFPGGTVVVPPTEPALSLAREAEDYIIRGLEEPLAWYLDQNALCFLYEKAGPKSAERGDNDLLFSLADLGAKRPLDSVPARRLFQEAQSQAPPRAPARATGAADRT